MNELMLRGVFENSKNKNCISKLVLACIAAYANENGQCFLSQGKIAKYCSLSISSVRKSLKELEADEYFFIYREGTGSSLKTCYILNDQGKIATNSQKFTKVKPRKRTKNKKPRIKRNRTTKYQRHLSSLKWRMFRKKIFDERGRCCEFCGCKDNLHLHHLTYENLFNEKPSDVMILCDTHHRQVESLKKHRDIYDCINPTQTAQFTLSALSRLLTEEGRKCLRYKPKHPVTLRLKI